MKFILSFARRLSIAVACLILSGCLYANVKVPYDDDLDATQLGSKVGKANSYSVLWLFAWGDQGIADAAKNGDLKVINHADQQFYSVLFGLYSRRTIIVYGE